MEQSIQAPQLFTHGEKTLAAPVKAGLFACCPTMDLIAVVCHDAQLDVYRLNGQRAFGYQPLSPKSVITSICWKFNGQSIAVGWEDGCIDVISADTGKVIQHIPNMHVDVPGVSRTAVESVAALGWGLNFVKPAAVKSRLRSPETTAKHNEEEASLDDFLVRDPDPKLFDLDTDLPDQLASLDLESQLPRLPALALLPSNAGVKPPGHSAVEAFGTQASLDALLHPQRGADVNAVDVLLRLEADGITLPILYGSLALRPLRRPAGLAEVSPIRHAYSPFASSHMVLAKTTLPSISGGTEQLAILPLTLPFTQSAGKHLQTISSKAARIQTLLDYISACLDSIAYHWRQSQDLPTKFMRVISDTLAENEEMGLVPTLYHLAATGHCPPSIKEWLTEQLMERGHKRWDHAVSLGYAKIVELTHESLLPAIDRCMMLFSNLRGLSTYYQDMGIFDVPPRRMTVAIEALQCLRILSHHLLHFAGVERSQFAAFSKWLRHEIDTQGADPATSEDTVEQDLGIDYSQVLGYIRGPLVESRVRPFVSEVPDGVPEIPAQDMIPTLIAKHVAALRKRSAFNSYALSMKAHFAALKVGSDELFELVVKWQLANSAYHMAILFDEEDVICSDVRVIHEAIAGLPGHVTTYVAIVPSRAEHQVHLYRIVHAGMLVDQKCIEYIEGAIMHFRDQTVRDVRFADDDSLVALVEDPDFSLLATFPYRHNDPSRPDAVRYDALQGSLINSVDRHAELLRVERLDARELRGGSGKAQDQASEPRSKHMFPQMTWFKPGKLESNGRKDRRTIYVLGRDRRHYKILDLDNMVESTEERLQSVELEAASDATAS